MRTDMRKLLSRWIARFFDLSIFAILTGTRPPFALDTSVALPYTIEPPMPDRMLFAGSATSENSITAAVQPIRIDGRETCAATRNGLRRKRTPMFAARRIRFSAARRSGTGFFLAHRPRFWPRAVHSANDSGRALNHARHAPDQNYQRHGGQAA